MNDLPETLTNPNRGKKPNGYWTKENTFKEAKAFVDKHGPECLTSSGLKASGMGGLLNAIQKNGGFFWIKGELGIELDEKPYGFWTKEQTLKEVQVLIEKHGPEALSYKWLKANGRMDLSTAISRNGGFLRIQDHFEIDQAKKSVGYWTVENTISEASFLVAHNGPKALKQSWLKANGRTGLSAAISRHGGFPWIREELRQLQVRKPKGYWSAENTVKEAKTFVDNYGYDNLTHVWLSANGFGGLAHAIINNGGIGWLREELGIAPTQPKSGPAQRRAANVESLKQKLLELQREGVSGMLQSQLVIIMQQGGFDKLPMAEGRDLFVAVDKGSLSPKALFDWSNGDEPEPVVEDEATPAVAVAVTASAGKAGSPSATEESSEKSVDQGGEPVQAASSVEPSDEPGYLPALALQGADEHLRLLDCEILASADQEALDALTSIALHQLWAKAYINAEQEAKTVEACRSYDAKRPWSKRVQQEFLRQYAGAKAIRIPDSYAFTVEGLPVEPRLMQRHVAFMAHERRRLLVLSDMGTGKSLAAQLSVMADGAQRILVLPINSCGHQWEGDFLEQWNGVNVHANLGRQVNAEGRRALVLPDTRAAGPHVWVVPIHLLSGMDDQDVLDLVSGFQPKAIVMDEVQFLKQRHDDQESARRRQAGKVVCLATELNPEAMVLSLSGTAVVNNLTEAKKLLELTLCEERPDLDTASTPANAMRMHQAFMANGIRQRAGDQFAFTVRRPEVDAGDWIEEIKLAGRHKSRQRPLALEKVLIEARIPAVVSAINGPTVVATQYVEGFVEPLRKAIEAAGYSVGVHTGEEQLPVQGHLNAIEAFKAGAVEVLLASINTLGTGVDGLQRVSSNLVIASMPWTAADYRQLIARLARSGQRHPVTVTIPTTFVDYVDEELGQARWSFCNYRSAVIDTKQRLMDAVMDGRLPEADDITEAKAGHDLGRWIERLSSKGALVRPHRPITVPLVFATETEELQARRFYGDWSSCNGRWNSTGSGALHARLQRNPQEWEIYHTDLEKLRLNWPVDPLQEAINWCARSTGLVIGDFGCGTAQLAEALRGRHTVHSFDHVAINESVVACDIAAGVPLADECLDLAIFSLSLMGSNWTDQLTEAHRCLRSTGQLLIWTAAKGKDPEEFSAQVEARGFKVIQAQPHSKWLHLWAVRSTVPAACPQP